MATIIMTFGHEKLPLKIKNINGVGFYDRLTRARYDTNIYLSLIVEEPKLTAQEWHDEIPMIYKEKIIQAIEKYVEENYVQPL